MEFAARTLEVPALHGIEYAARFLGDTSPWTLRKHIAEGNIKVVRIGRRVFLAEDELRRIAREGLPPLGTSKRPQIERAQSPSKEKMLRTRERL
jgi:hypothetical protein